MMEAMKGSEQNYFSLSHYSVRFDILGKQGQFGQVISPMLIIYLIFMEQECVTCGVKFDHFFNLATIVCQKNHVTCPKCASQLQRTRSRCPTCNGPISLLQQTTYSQPVVQGYPQVEAPRYYQPVPQVIVQQPYAQPQQYMGPQAIVQKSNNKPIIFLAIGIVLIFAAIAMTMLCFNMDRCSYWSNYYSYDCNQWKCCQDSTSCSQSSTTKCYDLSQFRNSTAYGFVLISIYIFYISSVLMCALSAIFKCCPRNQVQVNSGYVMTQ